MISCISFYNIFLCLFHRRLDLEHAAGRPALRLGGWTTKTTWCGLHGLPGSKDRGLDAAKLLNVDSCDDRRREKFYTMCHDFWILNFKFGIWIQGSGAAGHVSSMVYFSKFWKIKTRRLKIDLTLSLILRFNLRLGGYSIWRVSTSRTI